MLYLLFSFLVDLRLFTTFSIAISCNSASTSTAESRIKGDLDETEQGVHKHIMKFEQRLISEYFKELGSGDETGVVESACGHLVKDRMGKAGARWSLHGAESILNSDALRPAAAGINTRK